MQNIKEIHECFKIDGDLSENDNITVNDLQNYNPTQGITYFHPHETDVLFQHDFSRPRLESERVYDISIPQQIEAVKKDTAKTATLPQHSFTIKRRYRT